MSNSLASKYVRRHSAPQRNLYGDVIVVGYDRLLNELTGLTEYRSNELKRTLEWIAPLRGSN